MCNLFVSEHAGKLVGPCQKKCSTEFLFIVPETHFLWEIFSLGTEDWTRIITGNPNGGGGVCGGVLAVNGPFFWTDWAGPLPFLLLHWPKPPSICWFPSPPQVWNFFFFYEEEESSYNQTLVTDLTAAERRKHSFNNLHICAWYTAGQAQPVEGCWSFFILRWISQRNKTRWPSIKHVLTRPGWRLETFWLSLLCHFVGSPCPSCSEKR